MPTRRRFQGAGNAIIAATNSRFTSIASQFLATVNDVRPTRSAPDTRTVGSARWISEPAARAYAPRYQANPTSPIPCSA